MHWVDRIAKTLLRRGKTHVIASGISMSGHVHIGHCNDVFIADGVRRAIAEAGGDAEAFWYADDFDPMRRVPWPLGKEYEKYLGMPYTSIPSPDPNYKNFADFFSRPFVESLGDFGIDVKVYSATEIYRSGQMADLIRQALERAEDIRRILNKCRSTPLQEDWLPYDALCENCGRIGTTRALSWDGDRVRYRCEGSKVAPGCGHEGEADYTRGEGKLTWRVEWPARWKLLGVTCEPFGKDHAVTGGSYDTGKLIAKKIFDYKAPYPVPYEWVSLRGKPMSSSHGVVFTLSQWLEVAEPELLRYFIFRSKAMKEKNFDPGLPLLDLYDEYDMLEQVYFGELKVPAKKAQQLRRIYELSRVDSPPKHKPQRISFRSASVLVQVVGSDSKRARELLSQKKFLVEPSEEDIEIAMRRLRLAGKWVECYAPEHLRFKVAESFPPEVKGKLTPKQKDGLKQLASDLSSHEYSPIELHNRVYELAEKAGLKPPELFKAIYLVLLGKNFGPRVGNFISALDKKFVIKRFEEAIS